MFGPALTLVLALASSTVIAAPTVDNVYKRAVASLNPSSTVLPFHFPESVYENIPHSDAVSSSFSKKDDVKTATDFISKKLNLGANDFKVFNSYTDYAGISHVYGAHILNGARIANHQAAAHVKNGQVTFFSSSFGTSQHFDKRDLIISEPKATLDFAKASATASAQLGWKLSTNNFGKGGRGGDAVVVNVLNTSGVNNANFIVPADGRSGIMNMFRFTYTTPNRSSAFDNGIAIHEYAHGVSVRLTGGPATSGCLATKEAGGMGEGWSDMMTLFILAKSSDTATTSIPMGTYVTGRQSGVRSRPYTTDMRVNPLTYGDLRTLKEVHDVGEVWASLLWEVYWSLVTKHGFSSNLYDANQSAGNIVTMRIIIGGMMLQQCNPTFLSARDAIVAADINHYKGANKCEILKAFAKRGLGSRATNNYNNDFSVPSECGGNAL
ncbi:hypothetical protein BASA83_010446 [Batrachochytrium salamandrivorans]|nr:hypothetical protein BASA83_010446 [Batrachochytrium salamandrivorans]